jgi:hypothetical protein
VPVLPAALEVVRAAVLGQWRKLGPWMLAGTALALLGAWLDPSDVAVALTGTLALLAGVVLPLVAARGLRGWVNAGPLGLSARGGNYVTAAGFGLGASLVVMPFGVLAEWLSHGAHVAAAEEVAQVVVLLLTAGSAGAGAGRVAARPLPVLLVSWMVGGASLLGAVLVGAALDAGTCGELLRSASLLAGPFAVGVLTLGFSQLALWGLTAAGPRLLPSRLEP